MIEMRHRAHLSFCFLALVVAASLAVPSLQSRPAAAHHQTPVQQYGWGGQPRAIFSNYDQRGASSGAPVDWPLHFSFRQNAHVNNVKAGLCSGQSIRQYCTAGGIQYMYVEGIFWTGFDSDRGLKQQGACGENIWREHMRIYAPHEALYDGFSPNHGFYHPSWGYFVVATAHLDLRDAGSCPGRAHGYSEVAENWFIASLNAVPGWTVCYNCDNWANNANTFLVTYHGTAFPQYYENDSRTTWVNLP